jgi:hypothetical protein
MTIRVGLLLGSRSYEQFHWFHRDIWTWTRKFFQTFGILTANATLEGHLCRFVGKPMMKVYLPALRKSRMGLDWSKIDYTYVDPNPGETKKPKHH